MTKVSILGELIHEPKKIEFTGCLMKNCKSVRFDDFKGEEAFITPSNYKEIILITRGSTDVMLARKHNGEEVIFFGHFNDGVV